MKSTAKRIRTALWIVGAFAGLLAIVVLPGRWDRGGPAGAHVLAGVEIIDTQALCQAHNLDAPGGTNEVVTITIGAATLGGNFDVTYKTVTAASNVSNITDAALETALSGLATVGNVEVTRSGAGTAGDPYVWIVTFTDPAGQNVGDMTADFSSITGTSQVTTIGIADGASGDCALPASADADAHPSHYFNFDSDGDTTDDAILVSVGTQVRVVAHVHDGLNDVANGTIVTFSADGSAFIDTASRDTDADGALDNSGALTDITNAASAQAQTVSDTDAGTDGVCDAGPDTCIDGVTVQPGKKVNPDGIAIVQVNSSSPSDSTITASINIGGTDYTDTIHIVWTGTKASITIVQTRADLLTAQSTIAQAGNAVTASGDPDSTLTISVLDSGGLPVQTQNVDCEILAAGETARADLVSAAADGGTITTGPNFQYDLTDVTPGVKRISLETQASNTRGDVTVTCWLDNNPENDALDSLEIRDTITVPVAGPPATVAIQGNATMGVGSQVLTGTATDADGRAVADGTTCTATLIDPGLIAALLPASPAALTTAAGGSVSVQLLAAADGALFVALSCSDGKGTADPTDQISVTVSGVAPPVFPPGDVNCDNSFTVADLLAAARALVGLDPALTAC